MGTEMVPPERAPTPTMTEHRSSLRPGVTTIAVAVGSGAIVGISWPDLARGLSSAGMARPDRLVHLIGCVVLLIAAGLLARGARRVRGRRGSGLAVIAAGTAILSVSTAVMTMSPTATTGLIRADGPTPGQMGAFVVLLVGVCILPSTRRWSPVAWIDVGLGAIAVLAMSWLAPVRDSSGPNAGLADVVERFPPAILLTATMVLGVVYLVRVAPRMRPGDGALVVVLLLLPSTLYTSVVGQFAGLGAAALRSSTMWWLVTAPMLLAAGWQCARVDTSPDEAAAPGTEHELDDMVADRVTAEQSVEWVAVAATLISLSAVATQRMFIDSLDPVILVLGIVAVALSTARVALLQREQRELQRQLGELSEHLHVRARTDELTGLGNRLGLEEALDDVLAESGSPVHLFYADVDDFKTVNDALGHDSGDQLLVSVARRLVEVVGPNVYRLGGDEFVAVRTGLSPEAAGTIADRLIERSAEPVHLDHVAVPARLSIGMACRSTSSDDPTTVGGADLLGMADLALNRAKELGRGRCASYDAWLQERSDRRFALQQGLRDTVGTDRFEVRYRPQIDLRSGEVLGVEAMLRWRTPDDHLLSPSEYFAAAADTGLVATVSRFGVQRALRDWQETAPEGLPLWMGIHRQELAYGGLVAELDGLLGSGRRDVRLLISEAALMDPACQATVEQLDAAGHLLCVHEFGTASSSLRRLGRLRSPSIRFDGSFVTGLDHRPVDRMVLETVVALADDIGVGVSVDGVAHQWQVDELVGLGITSAQGWLFGRPCSWRELASRHLTESGRDAPFTWHPRRTAASSTAEAGATS